MKILFTVSIDLPENAERPETPIRIDASHGDEVLLSIRSEEAETWFTVFHEDGFINFSSYYQFNKCISDTNFTARYKFDRFFHEVVAIGLHVFDDRLDNIQLAYMEREVCDG
jgi:hypothetical protein